MPLKPPKYPKPELCVALFENSPVAIVIADDEGHYVEVNAAAEALFLCKREEMLGKKVTDFVAPMRTKPTERMWANFQEDGVQVGTFVISRPNGTDRIVRYSAKANFLPGLHLSLLRDITSETDF